jgi:hypothetical protein
VATTAKAELFVTVSLEDLVVRSNAATVFGSGEAGTLVGPETARRIACDAGIVPVVLGKDGQVLDLGRRLRLFTSAQLRALWLRDGGWVHVSELRPCRRAGATWAPQPAAPGGPAGRPG